MPGGESWSLVVSLERFGPSDTDIGLLAALGLLAAQAGGPLLAGGDTALALAEPAALAGWQTLRASEAAGGILLIVAAALRPRSAAPAPPSLAGCGGSAGGSRIDARSQIAH